MIPPCGTRVVVTACRTSMGFDGGAKLIADVASVSSTPFDFLLHQGIHAFFPGLVAREHDPTLSPNTPWVCFRERPCEFRAARRK